jgi:hypothetical protein
MKKLVLITLLSFFAIIADAQELMSKKGMPILPEPKDWSIGFDASPVLKYVGNFFNHSENNNSLMQYQDSLTLVGLYVKNSNTAYRASIHLSFASEKWTNQVPDQTNNSLKVNDERDYSEFGILLGLGIQKSRGKGRLRGNYGFEGLIGFGTSKNTFTYGNKIDQNNLNPLTTDWTTYQDASNASPANIDSASGARATSIDNGSAFVIGVRGFIGAEYFFAPKISISAEYGWSIIFQTVAAGEEISEYWNGNSVGTSTVNGVKKQSFMGNVDNSGGIIVLHVYF